MKAGKKVLLAAGLLAGAAVMTGCSADTRPAATPTPNAQQVTAAPATAQPAADMQAAQETQPETGTEETPIPVRVGEKELGSVAMNEGGKLLLPLIQTADALGWKTKEEQTEGETQTKRVVTMDKDGSRITISWTVSDNTAKGITWQKDGLLVPVDAYLTTADDIVYAPAAFFETAMDVTVRREQDGVQVSPAEPKETPEKQEQTPE